MFGNPLLLADDGYQISRSVRLRSSASGYFNRTPTSNGSRTTWTWSGWAKRGALSSNNLFSAGLISGTFYYTILGFGSDQLVFANYNDTNAGWLTTTQVFRDPSAWYHVVAVFDSTNATSTDRMRLYVNGNRITAFSTGTFPTTYPAQNTTSQMNTTSYTKWVGSYVRNGGSGSTFDGYLTEVNFIDGQALDPSSFGETNPVTGVWQPKKYTGTYGTNGFFLNFSDPSAATATAIGKDYSGNGNNWTPNNISVTAGVTYDSMLDVPTLWADGGNGRGNYCTLNPLNGRSGPGGASYGTRNGNLSGANYGVGGWAVVGSTMAALSGSGKWYWELTYSPTAGGEQAVIGIHRLTPFGAEILGLTGDPDGYAYGQAGGKWNNSSSGAAYGASWSSGDVIGIALDCSTAGSASVTFYKNNTSQGVAFSGLSGDFMPAISTTTTGPCDCNFGQRPFTYTPPTGFKALNTQNLPTPTIKKGSQYFDISTWTGDQSARTITNSGMQPDFLWTKSRSNAEDHRLSDAVRGGNGTVLGTLASNTTGAEAFDTDVTGFTSSGFNIRAGTNSPNVTGRTYVAWQWKEGATPGFDIVTYTGTGSLQTVSHSLGVAPKMIIMKKRSNTSSWGVYHASIGATGAVFLDTTGATATSSGYFNNTAPTSSVFTVGGGVSWNSDNGSTYVAYLFAEVAGFSKFGNYTGNGSSDGAFVYTGFRPAYVMIKRTDTTNDWAIHDRARIGYNVANYHLLANSSGAEFTDIPIDFLSNGFKLRGSSGTENASGGTYIYAAFAETPFRNSLAR